MDNLVDAIMYARVALRQSRQGRHRDALLRYTLAIRMHARAYADAAGSPGCALERRCDRIGTLLGRVRERIADDVQAVIYALEHADRIASRRMAGHA